MNKTYPAILLLAAALTGCGHSMDVPDTFVIVEESHWPEFLTRAVSADGVVLALRTEPNPKNGTVQFWSQAIQAELTEARQYELVERGDVQSAGGLDGTMMRFASSRSGQELTYLLAVFVSGGEILVSEAGGPTEAVDAELKAIRQSLLSVR